MAEYTWSDWLASELHRQDLTQADLVRQSDGTLTTPQVSRWLRKGERPHPDSVRAACIALGVSPMDGMVAAGYITNEELAALGATVVERPARGARALDDRELLDEIARRLERGRPAGSPGRLHPVVATDDPATEGVDWAARRRQD